MAHGLVNLGLEKQGLNNNAKLKAKLLLLTALLIMTVIFAPQGNGATLKRNFDHFNTGFPLSGAHVRTGCEDCHLQGLFRGTPKNCTGCHNGQQAPGKGTRHIVSDHNCDNCHTTFNWKSSMVDHNSVKGKCENCHNGFQAPGKHARHINTTASCESCHSTIAWEQAFFRHQGVTNNCARSGCHNGVDAVGKTPDHPPTNADCGDCHNTRSFAGARMVHANVTGACSQAGCHRDDKPADHLITTAECGNCHRTTAWLPALFDHSNVTPGTCNNAGCHSKPNPHFTTAINRCDDCHNTVTWLSVRYTHTGGNFPGPHNVNVDCIGCHAANSETPSYRNTTYVPDCAACHERDYDPGPHKKADGTLYTVSELKDCGGSCHIEGNLVVREHNTRGEF